MNNSGRLLIEKNANVHTCRLVFASVGSKTSVVVWTGQEYCKRRIVWLTMKKCTVLRDFGYIGRDEGNVYTRLFHWRNWVDDSLMTCTNCWIKYRWTCALSLEQRVVSVEGGRGWGRTSLWQMLEANAWRGQCNPLKAGFHMIADRNKVCDRLRSYGNYFCDRDRRRSQKKEPCSI